MKVIKQLSMALLAIAATAASAATSQPFTATSATIDFDTAFLSANSITVAALGSATVNATTGVGTLPLSSLSLTTSPGSLLETFASGAGVALTASGVTVNLTNFVFDNSNDTLYADLSAYGGLVSKTHLGLLSAGSITGTFGGQGLDAVSSSTSARTLNQLLSNFSLGADTVSLLGANADKFAFVASSIKDIKIGTVTTAVPEPTTYALMGLGLVGIAFARRKQQA
ncbi:MAG: PEP-CTERM sorting domain-containing protein [Aquabacterium sp.]